MSWTGLAPPGNTQGASNDTAQTCSASQPRLLSTKPPSLAPSAPHTQTLPSRNVIPGLGFATPYSHPLSTPFAPYPPPAASQTASITTQNDMKKPPASTAADKGSEEGEISEGEVEDLYEAPPSRAPAKTPNAGPNASNVGASSFRPLASNMNMPHDTQREADDGFRWFAAPLELVAPLRQRSGSYSPPLNPPGTDFPVSLPMPKHRDAQASLKPTQASATLSTPIHLAWPHSASRHPPTTSTPASPPQTVASSKEQARQAILQLWSHDVRYQNYLDHGIDRAILDNLFQELGLPVAQVSSPPKPQEPETRPTQVEAKAPPSSTTSKLPSRPMAAHSPPAQPAKSTDKSEERKDRIARLLAAKGSKAAAPAPVPAVTQAAVQVSTSKSDKSKLLQQKMEALLQSRAVLGQKRSLPPASADVQSRPAKKAAVSDSQNGIVSSAQEDTTKESLVPPNELEHTSPIPGLFLSPPQPLQTTESAQQKHTNSPNPKVTSSKLPQRPFDQSTGSRPFLIHVSDDEDAGEMDVDSPPDSHSPTNHGAMSLQRTAAIRGLPNISLSRHVSTGASPATPPRNTGGVEDLDKKIEDMKRKIAEAEARKKAKFSQQASPAPSPLPPGSENESLPKINGTQVSPPASRADQDDASASSPEAGTKQSRTSQDTSQLEPSAQSHNVDMNSRSRAASERLPLIEARRKAQLLKLQNLQSQIAAIEQEIQDGMQEEEALKQDLDVSEASPSHGHAQAAEPDAPNASKQESVQRDQDSAHSNPMDTTSPSSPSSSNSERSSDSDVADSTDAPHNQTTSHVSASAESELVESQSSREVADGHATIKSADDAPRRNSGGESDENEYEPPDAESSAMQAEPQSRPVPGPRDGDQALLTEAELHKENASKPGLRVPESSLGQTDSVPEAARMDMAVLTGQSFTPYETPLHYFHAYRFHPRFKQDVAGGLRSLTFSNKIDVQKQFCLDELQGHQCPRGTECEYQHFDGIKAPDDQILLQLGSADNYRDEQKTEYISGLRQLLTDFRNRKVKDFNTISQGIIDYHARFHGDRFKILPLDGVST
ncbi:hypothetical protein CDD81_3114 [Ophiocordyceps australis]|uniref:C3H1-type domain-containing protein n=1 Tax=Ophiocordyceps australis TaxID=1399860 RepID=A0A2C5Y6Z0_9HYPO|nr:hypothetical protein CDD81_3114 [Ophiocordyceps australis]